MTVLMTGDERCPNCGANPHSPHALICHPVEDYNVRPPDTRKVQSAARQRPDEPARA